MQSIIERNSSTRIVQIPNSMDILSPYEIVEITKYHNIGRYIFSLFGRRN